MQMFEKFAVFEGSTGTFCKLALKIDRYCPEYVNIKIKKNYCIIFQKNNEKFGISAISWESFQMILVRELFFGMVSSLNRNDIANNVS